jgi:hypothetical protein
MASPAPINGSTQKIHKFKNSQHFHIISDEIELYVKIVEVDEI